jgi:hypothetical protein
MKVFTLIALLAAALNLNAAIITDGSTDVSPALVGDDFGYAGPVLLGREVSVTGVYDVTFTAVYQESAFRNYFVTVAGTLFDDINIGDSYTIRTPAALQFAFGSLDAPGTAVNGLNQAGYEASGAAFAINWLSPTSLLIGYNDSFTGDADYDDLVIRADFVEVTEPMPAMLLGLGLMGIGLARMRRA